MIDSIKRLYNKHRSIILYIFWGGVTTLVSYSTYFAARIGLVALTDEPPETAWILALATVISWVIAVSVAFLTNKAYVFESKSWAFKTVRREAAGFFAARLLSLALDAALTVLLVGLWLLNEPLSKIFINVIVLILNYAASKFLIFKRHPGD